MTCRFYGLCAVALLAFALSVAPRAEAAALATSELAFTDLEILPRGVPVHQLQRLLGHHSLQSTLRYVHWIVGYRAAEHASHDLLAALEQDHA